MKGALAAFLWQNIRLGGPFTGHRVVRRNE